METTRDGSAGETPRWLELAEVDNIRDLGGLPVRDGGTTRRGVVFRASTLQEATADDVELLLGRYGLRTVLDLRGPDEAAREGHGLLADAAVRRMNLPVSRVRALVTDTVPATTADDGDATGFYLGLLDGSGESLVAAARVVADTDQHAVVFHCAVGKDRTGLTIAVVQSLLGASEADVTTDYLRSNAGLGLLDGPAPYLDETGAERLSRPVSAELLASSFAWIHDRHGSLPAYLHAHGATDADLDALRANLSA